MSRPTTSCYLLEFSTGPTGARHGQVHAYGDLGSVRASLDREGGVDDWMVIDDGAVLHLWVVQEGVVAEGIDLHPYLRTGDERYDLTLGRLVELRLRGGNDNGDLLDPLCQRLGADTWTEVVDYLVDELGALHDWVPARILPQLTQVFELGDRMADGDPQAAAEFVALGESVENGAAPAEPAMADVHGLTLDWDAVIAATPALRAPVLTTGPVTARLSDRWSDNTLTVVNEDLHAGLNDLESDEN